MGNLSESPVGGAGLKGWGRIGAGATNRPSEERGVVTQVCWLAGAGQLHEGPIGEQGAGLEGRGGHSADSGQVLEPRAPPPPRHGQVE